MRHVLNMFRSAYIPDYKQIIWGNLYNEDSLAADIPRVPNFCFLRCFPHMYTSNKRNTRYFQVKLKKKDISMFFVM